MDRLFGRESEIQLVGGLIDQVQTRGGALVVDGAPGIGKSGLLRIARARAADRGMRTLSCTGVESEALLPFAGLHQLLQPIVDRIDRLAERQRDALLAAFGMADAAAADIFLTALAGLDLLSEAASETPALVIVENADALDRSTADVLAFVARRLEYEPIVLIAATREGYDTPLLHAGLQVLHLEPLDQSAAAALLDDSAPGIPTAVRQRVLDEAGGNPLALVELPAAFAGNDSRGRPPAWLPLTTRLERAFAERLDYLPAPTRTLLLVAALNDSPSLTEVLAASRALRPDVTIDALSPAVSARLAEVDETDITYRHRLIRAAVAQQATMSQRHAAHAALAEVLVDQPDRHAWHRAASVIGPDEGIAAELEAVSDRAMRRGSTAIAAAALERAARMSEPARRAARLLRAAELGFELGRRELVTGLLQETTRLELGELERAKVAWLTESFTDGVPGDAAQASSLVELAGHAAAQGDSTLALKLLNQAGLRCWWSELGEPTCDAVRAAAERLPDIDERDPRLLAILAYAEPITRGTVVLKRLSELARGDLPSGGARLLGIAATAVGAFELAARFLDSSMADLRIQGRLGLLARALTLRAWTAAHRVDLNVGIPAAEEAVRLARETSQPLIMATAQATQAMLAGLSGDDDATELLAAQVERVCVPIGASAALAAAQIARGQAALGAQRYREAFEHLKRLYDPSDLAYHGAIRCFAIADLAEAALHSGQPDAGRTYVAQMEALAAQTASPALHAGVSYARALVAERADAERALEAALASAPGASRFLHARAQLAYGEWLHQSRRSAESRAPLRTARDTFDALGTVRWGERARQQLRASGETSRRRGPEARDELTPQELQIARLAAEGLSNREIGQMLYLSPRTISSHLYRVFPKLGITSRTKLRDALQGDGP